MICRNPEIGLNTKRDELQTSYARPFSESTMGLPGVDCRSGCSPDLDSSHESLCARLFCWTTLSLTLWPRGLRSCHGKAASFSWQAASFSLAPCRCTMHLVFELFYLSRSDSLRHLHMGSISLRALSFLPPCYLNPSQTSLLTRSMAGKHFLI